MSGLNVQKINSDNADYTLLLEGSRANATKDPLFNIKSEQPSENNMYAGMGLNIKSNSETPKTQQSVTKKMTQEDKEYFSKDGKTFDSYTFFERGGCGGEGAERFYLETLEPMLKKYQGKEITPDLVNQVILTLINDKDYRLYSEIPNIIKMHEYFPKTTIDKFLNKIDQIHVTYNYSSETVDLDDAKKFYNSLTPEQKTKYYQKLLTSDSVTGYSLIEDRAHLDFVDFIFEKRVSSNTYTCLKNLFKDINTPGNGIKDSKTVTKDAIEILLDRGQITQQQANELLKAGGINK